jgi:glycerophosphoryl diester phosphodiesterase
VDVRVNAGRLATLLGLAVLALLLGSISTAEAANRWIRGDPLLIAHQGGEDEFPSNTLYAYRRAVRAGADMLELDIGVSKDGHVVVMHDTTVDRTTNGHGTLSSKTLRQIKRLDAAYWFSRRGPDHYKHGRGRSAYPFRGVATGRRRAPRGFTRADFRVPTLREVLRAFPHTPINIEIKARTKKEETSEYLRNARLLARTLRRVRRRDLIVVSFRQRAVDLFHQLLPRFDVAPGIDGTANWLLAGGSPGAGVAAFQVPITFEFGGTLLQITTRSNVRRAHGDGYAWHTWFGDQDRDTPATWRRLVRDCVDGIMTSRPRTLGRVLRSYGSPTPCPDSAVAYHASGQWNRDISAVVTRAKRDLKRRLARRRPARPAVVLDIDDTSLSLYACMRRQDFASSALVSCVVAAGQPAIRQTRSLFRYARRRHVAVFFVTGRPEGLREKTVRDLRAAGYRGRWKLVLRPNDYSNHSLVPYKRGARRTISRRGYRILANLGDQGSDLRGGFSVRAYKLPNPMYVTP